MECDPQPTPSREKITQALARPHPAPTVPSGLTPSAVLLVLTERGGEWHVLLIRRSERVSAHRGQWALPGGRWEASDPDLLATALRETREEVGIALPAATVLGGLPPHPTMSSGYVIHPFVAIQGGPLVLTLDPNEVTETRWMPLALILEPANCVMEQLSAATGPYTRPSFRFGNLRIWGATAAILHHFAARLRGTEDL